MEKYYLTKYLKYKKKYLNLFVQYGKGINYSWHIINNSETREANAQEELELEEKYNKASATKIIFNDITYCIADNGDYINGNNILKREEKITNIDCNEHELFNELKKCAIDCGAILRVAGGWVRDKILKKSNDDIDIAIENMSGKVFSEHLFKHIKKLGNGWECSDIAIIPANAEKSKNLETATLKITIPNGIKFELDFVGLRSEVYDDPLSRVPKTVATTPDKDAMRRDLTINALFYNINTNKIEDYIGGVRDIYSGVIRTPLDPIVTFRDDPLRMLRALRFLSRFGFTLDEGIVSAMKNPELQQKLGTTISKERIGQEIEGFFKKGSNPKLAFNAIYYNGLWNVLFGSEQIDNWGQKSIELINKLTNLSLENILAALTLPLYVNDKSRKIGKKKKENSSLENFYLVNLRLSGDFLKKSEIINKCIFDIQNLPKDKQPWKRSTIALIVRDVLEKNLYNYAMEIGKILDKDLFENVEKFVIDNNLENCYLIKKFKGPDIKCIFGVEDKQLNKLLDIILVWQFDNPEKKLDDVVKEKDYFLSELKKKL
jgi:tRNA nucleotidyltransferase/poly(A) polymerase